MSNLIDQYDYVMNGKIFEDKLIQGDTEKNNKLKVFISFGGLMMSIEGDYTILKVLELDQRIYLCIKQI